VLGFRYQAARHAGGRRSSAASGGAAPPPSGMLTPRLVSSSLQPASPGSCRPPPVARLLAGRVARAPPSPLPPARALGGAAGGLAQPCPAGWSPQQQHLDRHLQSGTMEEPATMEEPRYIQQFLRCVLQCSRKIAVISRCVNSFLPCCDL